MGASIGGWGAVNENGLTVPFKKNNNMQKKPKILEITKIKIKLASQEIELTSDEARKVYEELKALFFNSDKVNVEEILKKLDAIDAKKEYIPYPTPYPIYIDRWAQPARPYWGYEVTCGGNSAGHSPVTNGDGILSINLTNQQY